MSKITDRLNRYRGLNGLEIKVGIIESKTYPNGMTVAEVGYINEYGTDKIPARPFFRSAVASERSVLPQMVAALAPRYSLEHALRMAGEHMVGAFVSSVMTWTDPPNAEYTIAQKGYNAPLRANDRLLRNSFSYEVNKP